MQQLPDIPYYRVTRLIQQGGTSTVYQGIDLRGGGDVAIKALHSDKARDQWMLRRFKEEANHYLLLSHPCLPRLVDFVEHDGRMYLVMELVDGMDIGQLLQQYGPLDADMTLHLMTSLLDTIGYLHEQGILHLDIKPANIMVNRDMGIKVLDLGISALASEGASLKKKCGSPSFMAPEQVTGDKLGVYTDIYQIGATLFNMVTGTPPYTGRTQREIFEHICQPDLPQLEGLVAPPMLALQPVIDCAMSKLPDLRYTSCQMMKQDLLARLESSKAATPEQSKQQFTNNVNNDMRIITIGREVGNDIVINDSNVSRRHLELIQDAAGCYFVRDLNSTNGTFVNGHRIVGERAIERHDIIRIGNTTLPWISYFATASATEVDQPDTEVPRKRKAKTDQGESRLKKSLKSIGKWMGRTALALLTSLLMMLMFYLLRNMLFK